MNVVEAQYPIGSEFEVIASYEKAKKGDKVILTCYTGNLEYGKFELSDKTNVILNYPDSSNAEVKLIRKAPKPTKTSEGLLSNLQNDTIVSKKKKSINIL